MDATTLSALSRSELQALAKKYHIKANSKSTIIIEQLLAKFAASEAAPAEEQAPATAQPGSSHKQEVLDVAPEATTVDNEAAPSALAPGPSKKAPLKPTRKNLAGKDKKKKVIFADSEAEVAAQLVEVESEAPAPQRTLQQLEAELAKSKVDLVNKGYENAALTRVIESLNSKPAPAAAADGSKLRSQLAASEAALLNKDQENAALLRVIQSLNNKPVPAPALVRIAAPAPVRIAAPTPAPDAGPSLDRVGSAAVNEFLATVPVDAPAPITHGEVNSILRSLTKLTSQEGPMAENMEELQILTSMMGKTTQDVTMRLAKLKRTRTILEIEYLPKLKGDPTLWDGTRLLSAEERKEREGQFARYEESVAAAKRKRSADEMEAGEAEEDIVQAPPAKRVAMPSFWSMFK